MDSFVMRTLKKALDKFERMKRCRDFELKEN